MNKTTWMGIGLAIVIALSAVPPSCQNGNGPSTDPSSTVPSSTEAGVTTPTETTAEPTTEPTIETTAPTETTIETTVETSSPTETTEPAGPSKVPGTPTPTPAIEETPESKTVYAKGTTNIRSGPGTSYSKVRTVSAGTALSVVARTANNWYRLEDSTYVSISVVTDTMPTPTPTPDPYATPTPAGISASQATTIAKGIVTSVRSANGLTTHYAPELDAECRERALTYTIAHLGKNGSLESCGGILKSGDQWTSALEVYDTSEEAVREVTRYLITEHVASMATNAERTEFGVGIAKNVYADPWGGTVVEYYIYISFASPGELQGQIDAGWYD